MYKVIYLDNYSVKNQEKWEYEKYIKAIKKFTWLKSHYVNQYSFKENIKEIKNNCIVVGDITIKNVLFCIKLEHEDCYEITLVLQKC